MEQKSNIFIRILSSGQKYLSFQSGKGVQSQFIESSKTSIVLPVKSILFKRTAKCFVIRKLKVFPDVGSDSAILHARQQLVALRGGTATCEHTLASSGIPT